MVLVLPGEKYKPKLLAALSAAFKAFWSSYAGLTRCEISTKTAA